MKNIRLLHPLMWVASGLAVAGFLLLLGGFFAPPLGVIDPSILTAAGIIAANQALIVFAYAVVRGHTATFTHGKTTATIGKKTDADEKVGDN